MEEKIPSLESEALCTLQEMQGANAEMLASNKVWLQTGIFTDVQTLGALIMLRCHAFVACETSLPASVFFEWYLRARACSKLTMAAGIEIHRSKWFQGV